MPFEIEQEEYLVTARKWRPLKFKDIVGQEHITVTLQNAIKSGRMHHAYLFSGPRGIGKTTTARVYARAINCYEPEGTEPCNKCESCEAILTGRSMDVIEIDGASNNSVDDIRKLRENAKYPPISGKYKMYIIDEVHMLSTSAFNALLKTLEEPPPHLLFVFATTEAHKVLPTILSRCQRFDFRRMDNESIVSHIKHIADKEKITIDDESLIAIAKKADGSMRDAQSTFDQVVAFCGNEIKYSELANALHLVDRDFFFRITSSISTHDLKDIFALTNDILSRGYDLQECLSGLLEHFRNILTVKATGNTELIRDSENIKSLYKAEADKFSKSDILRFMNLTATTEQALRFAPQPRIRFELALVQMASMDSAIQLSELLKELKELKKKALTNPVTYSLQENRIDDSKLYVADNAKPIMRDVHESPVANVVIIEKPAKLKHKKEDTEKVNLANNSINASDIKNGWSKFKEKYAKSKHGLFVLSQEEMVEPKFFNGELVLQCKNDFILDSFKNKSKDIKEFLLKFYKSPVNIKIVPYIKTADIIESKFSENIAETITNKEIETKTSPVKMTSSIKKGEVSPIEQAIIEMFGAKQMKVIQNGA